MSVIALDIGTTGCKAIVFDAQGKILGAASREYPILTPKPAYAEQDAELVWQFAMEALKESMQKSSDKSPKAMALSVQGEAVIAVDKNGKALRTAILGMDTRTTAQNNWLKDTFGEVELFHQTGMPCHTINTLPKLLWLKDTQPGIFDKAEQFLLYEDFFIRRFTGQAVISHCLASRTQMYDLNKGKWASDILEKCQIDESKLAPLAPERGGVVGNLRKDLANELGLAGELLMVSGGHDQACAALGSGVIEPGLAMVSTGTAEVVEVAMKTPNLAEDLQKGGISIYRHTVPGLYIAMTLNHSGGLLLRWFRDTFCKWQIEQAKNLSEDVYDLILKDAPKIPTGIYVLPHFAGSGTPSLDTNSKGAILGLTFAADLPTIAKAILEGLTFELRINLALLKNAGVNIQKMFAVGGGAKSMLWLQLKADINNITLAIPKVTEAACLGAAILAGVGVGIYSDYQTAIKSVLQISDTVLPIDENYNAYQQYYETYKQIYPMLAQLYHIRYKHS